MNGPTRWMINDSISRRHTLAVIGRISGKAACSHREYTPRNRHTGRVLSYLLCIIPTDLTRNLNTLRPRLDGCQLPDDIFKCIFLNENIWISIVISPKFVPKAPIKNIPSLVQIMGLRRSGDKPFLNQRWSVYWRMYASLRRNELRHKWIHL